MKNSYKVGMFGGLQMIGMSLTLLSMRLWMAKDWWFSGVAKFKDMETAVLLFENEYNVPILSPVIATYMATAAELICPILLVIGLFTRYAALVVLMMIGVIEFYVYPGTEEHYYWAMLTATILFAGAGRLSVDYFRCKNNS